MAPEGPATAKTCIFNMLVWNDGRAQKDDNLVSSWSILSSSNKHNKSWQKESLLVKL